MNGVILNIVRITKPVYNIVFISNISSQVRNMTHCIDGERMKNLRQKMNALCDKVLFYNYLAVFLREISVLFKCARGTGM